MIQVPPGHSGRAAKYEVADLEALSNEMQLSVLGDFEPLNLFVNLADYDREIVEFNEDWVDYLPRTDRHNNRKAISISTFEGCSHREFTSLAEASFAAGRRLKETEARYKTAAWEKLKSLRPVLDCFDSGAQPLGRTFIVKCGIGGYFVPHRDHPSIKRETFRIVCFLRNAGPLQYDWLMNDKKANIQLGQAYYVNTRLTHRTMSWVDDSHHLVLNVPLTERNVSQVLGNLAHTH